MEENVALDSSKQKDFIKSVRGIKKLIKRGDKGEKDKKGVTKDGKVQKKKRAEKGLVYLSHIPHGFYEHQMTEYFKQFGCVTNVRVIRSKKTGNSKGYAFIEFKDPTVAEIVAETMNNYLMGKRLLKAAIIPPEKQKKRALRMHWNNKKNPGQDARQKMKIAQNATKTEAEELQIARKLLANLSKTKKKLQELGIAYDFFTPVDVPEGLQIDENKVDTKKNIKKDVKENKENQNVNKKAKGKKEIDSKVTDAKDKKKVVQKVKQEKDNVQKVMQEKVKVQKGKQEKDNVQKGKREKDTVQKVKQEKVSEKDLSQNKSKEKLKAAGVKPLENFISIGNQSDSDDVDFDSDEFEKMLADDGDDSVESGESDASDDASDGSDDASDDLDDDVSDEDDVEVKRKTPVAKSNPKVNVKNQNKKNKPNKKENIVKAPANKRKNVTQEAAKPKKGKFEKQTNKKPVNKVVKKKK